MMNYITMRRTVLKFSHYLNLNVNVSSQIVFKSKGISSQHRLNEEKEREALLKQKTNFEHDRKKNALEEIRMKRGAQRLYKKEESESESGEIDDEFLEGSDSKSYSSLSMSDGEKKDKKIEYVIDILGVESIKATRAFLEKYHDLPIFEENIRGSFVKININDGLRTSQSAGYILGQIKRITDNPDKPYTFGNKKITKYLLVTHANNEKLFSYAVISNSEITESEFKVWFDRMEKVKRLLTIRIN
jgi:hypothetical protein